MRKILTYIWIVLLMIMVSITTSTYAQENDCCKYRTIKGITFVVDYPCRNEKRSVKLNDYLTPSQLIIIKGALTDVACFVQRLSDYEHSDESQIRLPISHFPIDAKNREKLIIPVRHITNWEVSETTIKFQAVYFAQNPEYGILASIFLGRKTNLYFYYVDNYVFEKLTPRSGFQFTQHMNDNHRIFTDEKALDQYLSEGLQ
jgi:hypothetical protein